jgi:hypothetical protein
LNRRDADRVEQALAGDRELSRRYDLVREGWQRPFISTDARCAVARHGKLFAAIDAEEARSPRRQRSFDWASRISEFLSGFTPRTLAWSATAAAVAILVQAAVITTVVVKDSVPGKFEVANKNSEGGSYLAVRFAPQATATEVTNFLGAYKATVVEGPKQFGMYTIRLSETKLPTDEVNKIIRQMQEESKIVSLVAVKQ